VPRLATFYGIVVYMYVRDHGVATLSYPGSATMRL